MKVQIFVKLFLISHPNLFIYFFLYLKSPYCLKALQAICDVTKGAITSDGQVFAADLAMQLRRNRDGQEVGNTGLFSAGFGSICAFGTRQQDLRFCTMPDL